MSIFKNRDPTADLWPHNQSAVEIDVEYYKNLPKESEFDSETMKPYINMFPINRSSLWRPYGKSVGQDEIVLLVSEWIGTEEEASHFARAVERHCFGITKAQGNIVFGRFHLYSIAANWSNDINGFRFANWS